MALRNGKNSMRQTPVLALATIVLIAGCAAAPPAPVVFRAPTRTIDYLKEVKPLLDKRCVVCHSCYNSPCQLKLDSFEGADRGATKKAIYNGTRLKSMDPTRLFTDARTMRSGAGRSSSASPTARRRAV